MARLKLLPLSVVLALGACATIQRATTTVGNAIHIAQDVQTKVTQVLDRPAPLANMQADERLIRSAYERFDQALSVIDSLVERRVIEPGSTNALRIASAVLVVKRELRRAYTAQQALNTGTVRNALGLAQSGLAGLITNLQREQ